ncbi:MAG: LAGLIDADG family homing endonuclease [Nanoarchaeota archaeon]|nr:LAGLIDADG family homing endonuclease [Nanoarchaeota archaeon]
MTVITKLSCKGFKSFAKKTEISLLPGFNCVIGANGNGKSLGGKSKVLVKGRGLVSIKRLVEEEIQSKSEIKTLKDGIYVDGNDVQVYSLNQNSMKQEPKKVSKFIRREGEPFLYEITTRLGRKLKATGCHPVMGFKENVVKSCLVSDLKDKDRIALPRNIKGEYNYHNPKLARLLGYIIGDGCISNQRIRFINADKELLEDYEKLMYSLFRRNKFCFYPKGKATSIEFNDRQILSSLLRWFNYPEWTKKTIKKNIPSQFMFADDETIGELLGGLFDTDGYVSKIGKHIEFCNKNENLVDQMQLLLLRFGIISVKKEKIKYATNTEAKTKRKYYSLFVYGNENYKKFYDNIPLKVNYKRENLFNAIKNINTNNNLDLLPKEVNELVKDGVKLLGLKVKYLANKYPLLKAYVGNECNSTREGIDNIVGLFIERWFELSSVYTNMKFEVESLVSSMDVINISGSSVSKSIGLQSNVVRDHWASEKFKPRSKNHVAYYEHLQDVLAYRLNLSREVINTLSNLSRSDIFWDEIVSIKKVKGEKYVYDLTVEDNHNFIAEGIYAHNSNVVDAICFVLGKSSAKGLRAEKSANLIYNGGKKGSGATEAEVSIYFDNSKKVFPIDDKEVKVTRVVKKTGNSVYRINGKVMTRQQMLEVLSAARIDPDGHNIVLQGDIVKFMEMKSTDRREVIEDIAGISIFEEKKQKAMTELNKVQEKLNEAEIILTEREKTLKDLKKDRDQALKYKELETNIERNKATRIHLLLKDKAEALQEVEKKFTEHNTEINKIQEEIDQLRKEVFDKKKEIEVINIELNENGDIRQRELQKDIESLKTRIIKDSSRKDVVVNELRKLKERKKSLQESLKEHENKVQELKKRQEGLRKDNEELILKEGKLKQKIQDYKEKNGISDKEDISKIVEELDQEIEKKQRIVFQVEEERQELLRKKDRLEYDLENVIKNINKVQDLEKEDREKIKQLSNNRNEFKQVLKTLSDCLNESATYSTQLSSARTKLMDSNEEFARLKTKSIGIREMNAADAATKQILSMNIPGVYGTVGDLGQVQKQYALALEVAAGPRMKSLVVSSDQIAAKCISILKESKAGIVTFLPLNKMREKIITDEEKKVGNSTGSHGLAIDLVSYEGKFSTIFKYVFGGTVVVDNMAVARNLGIGRARMVTLDGDLIESSGAMVGGYRRKSGGLGFKQKEVSENMGQLEKDIARLQNTVSLLEGKKTDNEEAIIRLRERKAILEAHIKAAEIKMGGAEDITELKEKNKKILETLKIVESDLKEFNKDASIRSEELNKAKTKRQKEMEKLSKFSNSEITKELESFQQGLQNLKENFIKNDSEINSLENQMKLYHSEFGKTEQIIKGNEKEFEEFTIELKGLDGDLTGNKDIFKIKEANQR